MTQQPSDYSRDATISVIMPARNAGETIAASLDSLLAQTRGAWRAIIIDDGSTDATRAIAEEYARRDPRISVIDGPQRGSASAARNAGLARADGTWILFLDSDDLIDTDMMERMMAALAANPQADAVHCHWRYIDWDGTYISQVGCEDKGEDLFPAFTRYCAFAIHSCVFKRSLLDKAGFFDENLVTCEDFDLWQRIARCGTRFIAMDDCLATYRLRANLSWFDAEPFVATCLEVIRRGHRADPRLDEANVPPRHRQGRDVAHLASLEINAVVMAAAMQIARGLDPAPLFAHFPPEGYPLTDSVHTAYTLINAIPFTLCRPKSAWDELWTEFRPAIGTFLTALEAATGSMGLAGRTLSLVERLAIRESAPGFRDTSDIRLFGRTAAMGFDTSRPIETVMIAEAERLECFIFDRGELLGTVALPVFDGRVEAAVLQDAIAANFAWQMLDRLFSDPDYPSPSVERGKTDWTIFIRELTGLRDWHIRALYDPSASPPDAPSLDAAGRDSVAIEISEPIPHIEGIAGKSIDIEVRVGGAPLFLTRVTGERGRISSGSLRATALDRGKMELARAAAREAIAGDTSSSDISLNERLRRAAQARAVSGISQIAPGNALVIGSLRHGNIAGDFRRAALPSTLAGKVRETLGNGQPVLDPGGTPEACLILPEMMARPAGYMPASAPSPWDRLLGRNGNNAGDIPASGRLQRVMERAGQALRRLGALPSTSTTDRLPILMYHAVGDTGPEALARWRITTAMFDAHMRYLVEAGFKTATLDEWRAAREAGRPLRGRRVIITFDDAYVDFEQNALPILQRHGLSAVLYVPTGKVGKTADWDSWAGTPLPLLDWDGLKRVRNAGIEIGSHSVNHPRLSGLTPAEMAEELLDSRIQLSRQLGVSINSFAYPSGDYDEMVEHMTGACGYSHGVTTEDGLSEMSDRNFALARIEVMGQRSLDDFVARVAA